jgi:hypothetical protein
VAESLTLSLSFTIGLFLLSSLNEIGYSLSFHMHGDVLAKPNPHYTCQKEDGMHYENLSHLVNRLQNYIHSYDKILQSNQSMNRQYIALNLFLQIYIVLSLYRMRFQSIMLKNEHFDR